MRKTLEMKLEIIVNRIVLNAVAVVAGPKGPVEFVKIDVGIVGRNLHD